MAGVSSLTPAELGDISLNVITYNCTSGQRIKELVKSSDAHVILAQEHKLDAEALLEYGQWLRARDWDFIASSSLEGPADNPSYRSGGTAILARRGLGLMPLPGKSAEVEPGRSDVGLVNLPAGRSVVLASLYLRDGEGLA